MEQIGKIVGAALMVILLGVTWVIAVGYIAGINVNIEEIMFVVLALLKVIVGIALIFFTIVVLEAIKDMFSDW